MRNLWIFLHVLAIAVWVGGMAFSQYCLRPALSSALPAQRLALMRDVLGRFLSIAQLAILLVWASGLTMMLQTGFANSPASWHSMLGVGAVMTIVFAVIRWRDYPALAEGVAGANWPAAGTALDSIRVRVSANLWLGVLTIALATLGRLL